MRKYSNTLYVILASCSFLIALVPLASILYETLAKGFAAVSVGFFTKPTPPIGGTGGGVLNAIEGSFVMVGIASAIAVPVGVLAGAYLTEYPGKIAYNARLLAEVLTGVPSIVTGIFVYSSWLSLLIDSRR